MARLQSKQVRLTDWAARRIAALSAELRAPQATLLRLMVVNRLTDDAWLDSLRDRFLGNRLPFDDSTLKTKGRRR